MFEAISGKIVHKGQIVEPHVVAAMLNRNEVFRKEAINRHLSNNAQFYEMLIGESLMVDDQLGEFINRARCDQDMAADIFDKLCER